MIFNLKKKPQLKTVTLVLDVEIVEELEKLGKFYRQSTSEVAREILHNVLTRKKRGKKK